MVELPIPRGCEGPSSSGVGKRFFCKGTEGKYSGFVGHTVVVCRFHY